MMYYFDQVYDLLIEYGASKDSLKRKEFIEHMTHPQDFIDCQNKQDREYRFGGIFGWGGKCRLSMASTFPVSVYYYSINKTNSEERNMLERKCKELNEKIKALGDFRKDVNFQPCEYETKKNLK